MKMSAVLKRQQCKNSGSKKTEPRGSKCQRLYTRGDEEWKGLDKFESEGEAKIIGYVSFSLVALFRKESNRLTDMGEGTKSLNHLI